MADADRDLGARWQAIRDRLNSCGYENIPQIPPPEGWVFPSTNPFLPRVGIWLMPDNQLPGILENFVAQLIPPEDALYPFLRSNFRRNRIGATQSLFGSAAFHWR